MECLDEHERYEARQLNNVLVASLGDAAFTLLELEQEEDD